MNPPAVTPWTEPEPVWELATLYPPQGAWNEQDYLALTDGAERRIEHHDGRLEFLSMPTDDHQDIMVFLFDALRAFVLPRSLGKVQIAGIRVRIAEGLFRMPDVVFLASGNLAKRGPRYWDSADLVMEVVSGSPEDRARDYEKKFAEYASAGIAEYWIVDPEQRTIGVYALEGAAYAPHGVFRDGDQATSRLLEGFVVGVGATFAAAGA